MIDVIGITATVLFIIAVIIIPPILDAIFDEEKDDEWSRIGGIFNNK